MALRALPGTLVVLVFLTTACEEATERSAVEIADSAGVRVVVNPEPAAADVLAWSVIPEPEVEIGVVEGPPEYTLFRVTGAALLPDGTIVVADGGTQELRFYDGAGRHVRSAGGRGEGPGEFGGGLSRVASFAEDSLAVLDFLRGRVAVFDREGRFAREFVPAEGLGGFLTVYGVLSDGSLLVWRSQGRRPEDFSDGVDRTPVAFHLVGSDGVIRRLLGEFPGSESASVVHATSGGSGVTGRSVTFGRGVHASASRDRIAVGNDDGYSVRVYDAAGDLLHVVRQRRDPVPVGPDDFEGAVRDATEGIEDLERRRRIERLFEMMPRHETFPAYESLRVDRDGNLWVEEYRRPGDDQPVWQVFDRQGVLTARVETPAGLRVLDLGERHVLGVVQDELGVQRVRLYGIEGGG